MTKQEKIASNQWQIKVFRDRELVKDVRMTLGLKELLSLGKETLKGLKERRPANKFTIEAVQGTKVVCIPPKLPFKIERGANVYKQRET